MDANSAVLVSKQVIILLFVMVCGIFCRKTNLISQESNVSISKILLILCQSCLIITSFQTSFSPDLLKTGLKVTVASVIIHISLLVLSLFAYNFIKDNSKRKIYRFATMFGNCGFLGFPVLNAMYGNVGVLYGAFFTTIFNIIAWSYGVYMLSDDQSNGKKFDPKLLKKIINPGTVSTLVGVLLFIFKFKIPSPLIDAIDMVGDMTFPLSMLVVGSLISDTNFKNIFKNPNIYYFCFLKLLLFPFISIIICKIFSVDRNILAPIAIIMTGVPAATVAASMPELYGGDSKLGAELVGVSTILSIATIPLLIYLANIIL